MLPIAHFERPSGTVFPGFQLTLASASAPFLAGTAPDSSTYAHMMKARVVAGDVGDAVSLAERVLRGVCLGYGQALGSTNPCM